MKTYIGVKKIDAEEMTQEEFLKYKNRPVPVDFVDIKGYVVFYPDGYESWSPKEVFEAAYFPLTDPTKICEADVEAFIGTPTVERIDPKTTLVGVETMTGFVQHEVSSCVDPANYDEAIGTHYAMERIKSKIWPCLGFVLQWAKDGLHNRDQD